MATAVGQNWNLDVLFPGGSASPEFEQFLDALAADIATARDQVAAMQVPRGQGDVGPLAKLLDTVQGLGDRLEQAFSFVTCLTAQKVKDQPANLLSGRVQQIAAASEAVRTDLDQKLLAVPDSVWPSLVNHPWLHPIAFALEERRRHAAERLPGPQEQLITDLAVDGYHAWDFQYRRVVGRMTIPFEEDGRTVHLSVGQAENRLRGGNRPVRTALFARVLEAWAGEAEMCAAALNHLAGHRLAVYRHRGWDSVLKEPLDNNRMSARTLEAMWGVVEQNKDMVVAYLRRKARMLGLKALSWHDVNAPIGAQSGQTNYPEAQAFIIEQFGRFSPPMADFARRALAEGWVEAEDRPGKRPGAFDTAFPVSGQSRVFMTFSGIPDNVMTLAHELGHAYHDHVTFGLPFFARDYAMNVAETASTFAETIVANAAIRHAATPEHRLALLEQKVSDSVDFLMNLHARFLFEIDFYEQRRRGPVSVERLNELMVAAQRRAYRDTLAEWHPYFWAAKLHFYRTRTPFYNFPYTFGYLFSTGLYARAQAEGRGFAQRYVDLLRDTARMTVEDLASRHLDVDLTQPGFWQSAVDVIQGDIAEFLRLTEPQAG